MQTFAHDPVRPPFDIGGNLSGMELRDAIRRRRMVRTYQADRPVPREILDELLELAVRAPSAGHTQGWHFLVLDDAPSRARFWAATGDGEPDPWLARMRTAPALIIVFSDREAYLSRYAEADKGSVPPEEQHWPVPYWHIDAGMSAMILLLAAVDAGLGALFFGVPSPSWPSLRAVFGVPERFSPIGVIAVGYAAPDVKSPSLRRGRRPFSSVVSYGSIDASGAVD